jgi:phosphotransferase system  glucose/maltose/N-acetylglucosamine-specific IIC component
MFSWIYDASVLQQGAFLSGGAVAVMWLGIIFVKPILRLFFRRQDDINTVVGNTTSAFSVFYGLLLGLISVATYQNFSNLRALPERS